MNKRNVYSVSVGELDDCTVNDSTRPARAVADREIVLCPSCLPRIAEMIDSLLETPNWLAISEPSQARR